MALVWIPWACEMCTIVEHNRYRLDALTLARIEEVFWAKEMERQTL